MRYNVVNLSIWLLPLWTKLSTKFSAKFLTKVSTKCSTKVSTWFSTKVSIQFSTRFSTKFSTKFSSRFQLRHLCWASSSVAHAIAASSVWQYDQDLGETCFAYILLHHYYGSICPQRSFIHSSSWPDISVLLIQCNHGFYSLLDLTSVAAEEHPGRHSHRLLHWHLHQPRWDW